MKVLYLSAVTIVGFVLVYFFWPNNQELPVLTSIEEVKLESIDKDGYRWDNSKIKVVSFFYTNCPDICPLTLGDMSKLQNHLKEEGLFGDRVELVSITLDPQVDTIQKIKGYSKLYNADGKGWEWLTGSEKQVTKVASNFQMQFQKSEDGFVTHGTKLYLLDERLRIRGVYDMATRKNKVDTDKVMEEIRMLLKE
ncbi:SCO family protein [Guptibacillus algicola]|uniref:SCO family protein n=1 Tax=Guptibacillus algicola TaxID=225844 RepID=UPI001CD76B18|nr:SCO family protein [Alkalihalobacillus algicola]MCA0986772.1 SCO family protein [Alkalihalobacillus algicola]